MTLRSLLCFAAALFALPLLAVGSNATVPQRLLVATRTVLIVVDGDRREVASAGVETFGYRLLGTAADGSVIIAYEDTRFAGVEAVSPALTSRTVRTFPRTLGSVIGFAPDGYLVADGTGLIVRYDLQGRRVGAPAAALGASAAIGIGDAIVTLGNGRLSVWDARGRLHKQLLVDADPPGAPPTRRFAQQPLAAMPNGRFAVIDARDYEVRQYTTELEQTAVLRFPTQALRALAAGPDGSLAVLTGVAGCSASTSEVDVFDDLHAQPAARIRGSDVFTAVALAVDRDGVYVANAGCNGGDGSIAAFGHDGTRLATTGNVGSPVAVLPFPRPSP